MKATKTWRDMLSKSLSDPNFRKEWKEANAELAELAELDKIIAARASAGLTQADVAVRMGTTQSAVARLESNLMRGRLPSGRTLTRYAKALGKRVVISFV